MKLERGRCTDCGENTAARTGTNTLGQPQYHCLRCAARWTKGHLGEPWDSLQRALWEKDLDTLHVLARCICCCSEHFFEDCPARAWSGCHGQESLTLADYTAWETYYRTHHGLSRDQFYGVGA